MNLKRSLKFVFLGLIVLFLCGCETVKGAATGVGSTAAGVTKDSKNIVSGAWQTILKADDWMKKNLW